VASVGLRGLNDKNNKGVHAPSVANGPQFEAQTILNPESQTRPKPEIFGPKRQAFRPESQIHRMFQDKHNCGLRGICDIAKQRWLKNSQVIIFIEDLIILIASTVTGVKNVPRWENVLCAGPK